MTRTTPFYRRVVCAALMVLTACQDVPLAIAPTARGPVSHPDQYRGQHLGEMQAFCGEARREPSAMYELAMRIDTFFFPRAEWSSTGRMVLYKFRQVATNGVVISGADCMVPYTETALRRVDRFFRVIRGGGADQFRARQEMITTQGCVTEDAGCTLDPIVVTPEPTDNPVYDACDLSPTSCDGGGWYSGGGSGSGGGTGGSVDPDDDGPLLWAACVSAGLAAIGGGILSYVSLEQYYAAVRAYGTATVRYQYAPEDADRSQLYTDMMNAEFDVKLMTAQLAASALVTVGALFGVVAACSPSVFAPTP
jgi:hypothetical protein